MVVGYGHRRSTLEAALGSGAIDEAYDDPAAAVRGADLIVLCTPVGVFDQILNAIGPELSAGALVTDVGSTKRQVVGAAERTLPPHVRFVGSHPMAGSEKRGVQFARGDLFQDALCITTPTDRTDPSALESVEAFWHRVGMRTARLSPEEHDRRLADVSHLPHAVAAALVAMQEEDSLPLAGKGFRDATRIAAGDGGLWRDILIDNRDNLAASLRRLRTDLDELLARLDAPDPDGLKQWLDAAGARRAAMTAARDGNRLS